MVVVYHNDEINHCTSRVSSQLIVLKHNEHVDRNTTPYSKWFETSSDVSGCKSILIANVYAASQCNKMILDKEVGFTDWISIQPWTKLPTGWLNNSIFQKLDLWMEQIQIAPINATSLLYAK